MNNKTITSIDIIFENQEYVTINEKYIIDINMTGLERLLRRFISLSWIEFYRHTFIVIDKAIDEDISSIKGTFEYDDYFSPSFSQYIKRTDVTGISINFDDNTHYTFSNPWVGSGEEVNEGVITYIDKEGNYRFIATDEKCDEFNDFLFDSFTGIERGKTTEIHRSNFADMLRGVYKERKGK